MTGRICRLLCLRCNDALGDFEDDHDRLYAALRHLGSVAKCPATEARVAGLLASAGAATN